MLKFVHKGSFKNTEQFFKKAQKQNLSRILNIYGDIGVKALSDSTPKKTGLTADSWFYRIDTNKSSISIVWSNKNVHDGVNIALILQYGHGTGTGGYVQGIDYINPALEPVFKELADSLWKEVTAK